MRDELTHSKINNGHLNIIGVGGGEELQNTIIVNGRKVYIEFRLVLKSDCPILSMPCSITVTL
jgi:hypothetical protein